MIPHFHEDRLGVILKELEPFKKEIQGIVAGAREGDRRTTGIGWWTDYRRRNTRYTWQILLKCSSILA